MRGADRSMLRCVLAPNPSAMTLDGTRTYLVGRARVAVIDPGPADAGHLDALTREAGAGEAVILLTHTHPDHAAGARDLAARLGCAVRGIAAGTLADGDAIATDAGDLVALHTPGHTRDHASFHWRAAEALFCGDLMMGGMDTALVAPPDGDLTDYLASLARIGALRPRVLYPSHGPPFADPRAAIARYVHHRAERETQVLAALEHGARDAAQITAAVYGDGLQPDLRDVAREAVLAYLVHLERGGGVRRTEDGRWARSGARSEG